MSALGIVFHFHDRTAVIHYQTCRWYQLALHTGLPLTSKVKIRFCNCCRPTPEDVRADPPPLRWFEFSPKPEKRKLRPAPTRISLGVDMEYVDKLVARRELGIGRRGPASTAWPDD